MCVMSKVYDHYSPKFPDDWWKQPQIFSPPNSEELFEIRELIKEFREAIKLAKRLDQLTDQEDCEDPDKAKLEARVAELENQVKKLLEEKKKVKKNARNT